MKSYLSTAQHSISAVAKYPGPAVQMHSFVPLLSMGERRAGLIETAHANWQCRPRDSCVAVSHIPSFFSIESINVPDCLSIAISRTYQGGGRNNFPGEGVTICFPLIFCIS